MPLQALHLHMQASKGMQPSVWYIAFTILKYNAPKVLRQASYSEIR